MQCLTPQGSVANSGAPDLRPLSLDDFIQSKAKVVDWIIICVYASSFLFVGCALSNVDIASIFNAIAGKSVSVI